MGYPFHKATEIVTAKCAKCGVRIAAFSVHYRYYRDKKVIDAGYYGVQDSLCTVDRMIETFCSIKCAKHFVDATVTQFEVLFEESLVELCSKGLHPMTAVNSYVHPVSGNVLCRQCRIVAARNGWHTRIKKAS
jgi:hypothetical protein